MIRRLGGCLLLGGLGAWAGTVRADQFEQLDGPTLARAIKGADATARPSLTFAEIGAMPALLRDTRSALVLARSGDGNPARLLLVPELRKPSFGTGQPFPVLVVERLDAFDASDPSTRLATRRDVVLYDGFHLDLDSGQVVPEGQGGDVVFRSRGEGGPRLEAEGESRLFTLGQAPPLDTSRGPQPTPGRAIVPADFAGRYRLFANGQWSGTLDLKVEARGVVTGRFRSDLHGTAYPVTGQVAADSAGKLRFAIALPRARQEFDAYLWGEGKGAMAGTLTLLDRTYGFFAVREGGRYAPEGRDLGPLEATDADRPGRHLVDVRGPAEIRLDARPVTLAELTASLKAIDHPDPAHWVLIRATPGQKFDELMKLVAAIQAGGIGTIRFEPSKMLD